VDEQSVRDAFARHAGGVVVVSARVGAGFRGLTATSFISVSLEPPLVVVALDRFAATRDAVVDGRKFNVSVLEAAQEFVADRFAGRAPMVDPSWLEVGHVIGANGLPIIAGSVAWFECAVETVVEGGDHDLVVGSVTDVGVGSGEPLVLWDRSFWRLGGR
jgi:flavin reductase (DIM6/NTAB) family NADH-FMN oxidoreductase RutF